MVRTCRNWLLTAAVLSLGLLAPNMASADLVTDPGAPEAGAANFGAVILDDSLFQPGVAENYTTLLPARIVEGDLVLLDFDNLAFVNSQAALGILHPEFWSDIVHFRNDPTLGPLANILSFDQFSPGDLTSNNVLYIVESAFIGQEPPEGVGGLFTPYLAGDPSFANLYLIESVRFVPEPGSIALLGLGGLVVLGGAWKRRRRNPKTV